MKLLTVDLNGVDCFTYLDYVVALSKSQDIHSFLKSLIQVRYQNSNISYLNRKHFFTDWYVLEPKNTIDITSTLSSNSITVEKELNKKSDTEYYIDGLGYIIRKITYIPNDAINEEVIDKLKTGDLIGIYSHINGLDVTHTGLIIKKNNNVFFRHASSKSKKVVDVKFMEYIKLKPGIIVLRIN